MATVASPPRTVQAELSQHNGLWVLILTVLQKYRPRVDLYFLTRLDCPDVAYRLRKVDRCHDGTDAEADHYHVNVTARTCECKGFLRWDRPCKHLQALATLAERGLLP